MELLKSDYTKTLNLIKMTENYLNNMDKSHPDYIFYTKNLIMLEKLKEQQEKKLEAINHN
jgi:uncharacterized short protein YbdD (DUF466 family)